MPRFPRLLFCFMVLALLAGCIHHPAHRQTWTYVFVGEGTLEKTDFTFSTTGPMPISDSFFVPQTKTDLFVSGRDLGPLTGFHFSKTNVPAGQIELGIKCGENKPCQDGTAPVPFIGFPVQSFDLSTPGTTELIYVNSGASIGKLSIAVSPVP